MPLALWGIPDFFRSFPERGLFDPCRWPMLSQVTAYKATGKEETWKRLDTPAAAEAQSGLEAYKLRLKVAEPA